MADPQQELFSHLLSELRKKYDVYDGFLPPAGTEYPFIYIADSVLTDEINKTAVFGEVSQTVHVWHNNPRQRGTVSAMLLDIKSTCRRMERTSNFAWLITNVEQTILADDSTAVPLVHGVLEITFKFS